LTAHTDTEWYNTLCKWMCDL